MANTLSPNIHPLKELIEDYISGKSRRAGKGGEKGRTVIEVDIDTKDTRRVIGLGVNIAFIHNTIRAVCGFYSLGHLTDALYSDALLILLDRK